MSEIGVPNMFNAKSQGLVVPVTGDILVKHIKANTQDIEEIYEKYMGNNGGPDPIPLTNTNPSTNETKDKPQLIEALEFTDYHIPGDIRDDEHGKLLKAYLKYEGPIGSQIETYNRWITKILGSQLAALTFQIPEGVVTIDNVLAYPPRTTTSDNSFEILTPQMCREKGYTYSSEVYFDLVLNSGTLQEERISNVFLGKIPVMLGSCLCHLSGKTDEELIEMGECPMSPTGYFIRKGSEMVIMIQEKLRVNRIFTFNSSSKGDVVCKMTCNTVQGSSQVVLVQGKKSHAIEIHLGFMGRSEAQNGKIGNTMAVFQIYRMLGFTDPNEILRMVSMFTKKEYIKKIWVQLQPTFVETSQVANDIDYIAKKKGMGDLPYNIKESSILNDLKNQLFPQVPVHNIRQKLMMLSMMVARFTEFLIGVRQLDDRDNWGNKRLESAGRSLEQLFANIWREVVTKAQDTINDRGLKGLQSVRREIDPSFITDNFASSFTPGNWGVQSAYKAKENITEILKRDANLAVYSHLTKINTPTSRKAKQMKIRLVPMSQLGYVCPAETPEGAQCGLVKNAGITLYISLERDENVILELIKEYISPDLTHQTGNPIILNGKFLGWCAGEPLRNYCVAMKRQLTFYKDTCIVLSHDGVLYIYTDAARPCRPLLVVDSRNNELVIKNKNLWGADMHTLLSEGCVEYIDAFEQEYIQLAQSFYHMEDRKKELTEAKQYYEKVKNEYENASDKDKDDLKIDLDQAEAALDEITSLPAYTHCELDPTAILGLAASLIPLANHNQAPRNTYQCIPSSTLVMTSQNDRVRIGDLKNGDEVITIDPVTLKASTTKIHSHFVVDAKDTNKSMVEIKTFSGRCLKATTDHKFLTFEEGWVDAGDLNKQKHHIAIFPSLSVMDNNVDVKTTIMDSDMAKNKLMSLCKNNALVNKYIKELEVQGLLPLSNDNVNLPIIARMMGFMRSDGHLSYTQEKGLRSRLTFGRLYDAEVFNNDIKSLGFKTFKIQERRDTFYLDNGEKKTTHHVWVIDRHGSFASLFVLMGCVMGRKTEQSSTEIPVWIMNGTDLVKREYLSGFMGGDGCKINTAKRNYKTKEGMSYDMGRITQHKNKQHLESSLNWFKQFRSLLEYFSIKTSKLNYVLSYDDKYRVELEMSSSRCNLIRYMDTIGYRYASTKFSDSLKVVEWLKYIEREISKTEDFRKMIHNLHYEENLTHPQLAQKYNITVARSQHLCKQYRKGTKINMTNKTIRLEKWMKCVETRGEAIYVPIESITTVPSCIVSDFTTVSDNHSFVTDSGFVTHNCGMGKQSLGIYHSQHYRRFDTTAKCLAYPSRPLFETQMYEALGMNELPAGSMLILAIGTYTGFNQEDAIIMNQSAIERGLFRQAIFKSFKNVQKRTRYTTEEFTRPEPRRNEPSERYAAIDEKGIAIIGSFVREGDCIIGKVRKNLETGKVENASTYVGVGLEGIIDRVSVSVNPEGMTVIKVKLRQIRAPIMGDKFASRHAQKATIGKVLPQEQMPFTKNGIVPDIIINPHCIPSRMTMAKMIEIIVSKAAALSGERGNATAFRRFNLDEFKTVLQEHGYSDSGKEKMFSGFTGKPFEAEIYVGPCYYQVLRHHVADKIQMRARGAIKQLSHQPVGGRARKGGQRCGEMERDAIISHGASAFLQERLCGVSDAYQAVYCRTCGHIAIANMTGDSLVCRRCESDAQYGTNIIPYAYKYMTQILAGAGFEMKFIMTEDKPTTEILA